MCACVCVRACVCVSNVGHFERLTDICFVFNILRHLQCNYKAISKIKDDNRASNKPYNLFEFLKFPNKDPSL